MGLEERLWTAPGGLSGGQCQALALLMATWHKPRVLLLDIVQREQLTTLMVTHSMQQAVNLGNLLLMMYRGRVLHDFSPSDKRWLKPADLQDLFEQVRRKELLDPSAAEMLAQAYI
jgi:putative ABC transport system ATP-binding protein